MPRSVWNYEVLTDLWHDPNTDADSEPLSRRVWVSMKRVYLTSRVLTAPPTIVSRTIFRLSSKRMKIRVFMPPSQIAPGYLSGSSSRLSI